MLSKYNYMIGQQFDRLKVLSFAGKLNEGRDFWFAECDCNKSILVQGKKLRSGHTTSCGCKRLDNISNMAARSAEVNFQDLSGNRYDRLLVIEKVDNSNYKSRSVRWRCLCDCGNIIIVQASSLKSGHTRSCGCLRQEILISNATTHGASSTRLYQILADIKQRCYNIRNKSYKNYGEVGIKLCDEWQDFFVFREYAIANGYNDSLTIERKNPAGNYEPGNVIFISLSEQAKNKRSSIFIEIDSVVRTLGEWANIFKINRGTAWFRYQKGLPLQEVFQK